MSLQRRNSDDVTMCHHNAVYTNDITMKRPLATIKLYYTILIVLDELQVAAKFFIFSIQHSDFVVSLFILSKMCSFIQDRKGLILGNIF